MSQVHLHLLITHLPVFGSILGALVLGFGIWKKSNTTKLAAYSLFVLAAIGATVAYLTGEGAEETVEDLPGVAEQLIGRHETAAMYALVSLVVLGFIAVFAWIVTYRKTALVNYVATFTLLLSLISFGLVARTGYLGGQIRHTEVSGGLIQNSGNAEEEQEHE
ncbi:MAG: hypothetical protein JSU05_00305 [Bacteroidetes bacterium]|nr:hypothetical protein [Bacteroidota bacterium]